MTEKAKDKKEAKAIDAFSIESLEKSLNDSATRVSAIWLSFVAFSAYLAAAVSTVSHRQLFLEDPIKLPTINIDLPLLASALVLPLLYVIYHIYVLLQVLLLSRTAATYNTAISRAALPPAEDASLRQRLANTLFAQIFAGSPREREGWLGGLLKTMAWITLAVAPVLITLLFLFKFLPYHSHLATWAQRAFTGIELIIAFVFWPLVLNPNRDFHWKKISRSVLLVFKPLPLPFTNARQWRGRKLYFRVWRHAFPQAAFLLFIIAALGLTSFPGELHVNLLTAQPSNAVQCNRWFFAFDRLDIPGIHVRDDAKLRDTTPSEKADHPSKAARTRELNRRNFDCANIADGDLRRIGLSKASLQGARLYRADLRGSVLDDASLQNARLDRANLQGASLGAAQLQNANLDNAELEDGLLRAATFDGATLRWARTPNANFLSTSMRGVVLSGAKLPAANFGSASLQGALLDMADLQGAVFTVANLEGAVLNGASLQGAIFSAANLKGARLHGTFLQGSIFTDANLEGAVLDGSQLQGADMRNAAMTAASLFSTNLQGASLGKAQLDAAQLSRSRLQGADLSGAQLAAADLSEAQLQGAIIGVRSLGLTDLHGAFVARAIRAASVCPQGDPCLDCTDEAWSTDVQVDDVIEVRTKGNGREERVKATSKAVDDFIDEISSTLPQKYRGGLSRRLRSQLHVDPNHDTQPRMPDTHWRRCVDEPFSRDGYEQQLAEVLGSMICRSEPTEAHIAKGIVRNWLGPELLGEDSFVALHPKNQENVPTIFASMLAQALVGPSGDKVCAGANSLPPGALEKLKFITSKQSSGTMH